MHLPPVWVQRLWERFVRRDNWPAGVLFVFGAIGWVRQLIQLAQDIDFVSTTIGWGWLDTAVDILFHPIFSLVAVVVAVIWALVVGSRPLPETAEATQPSKIASASGAPRRSRPTVTANREEPRVTNKVSAQKHKKLRSGSLEFLYGAHAAASGESIKLRIQLPDGRWRTAQDSIVPGLYYYPVRFVFPDDFDGETLASGTYHVSWLTVTPRIVHPPIFSPISPILLTGNQPTTVYDEKVVASEEFTI
jgi:hypothetical protein